MLPNYHLLIPGSSHKQSNQLKAMRAVLFWLEATVELDKDTVWHPHLGKCHVAPYTDKQGAMICNSSKKQSYFGSEPWHAKKHICMVRDTLDGFVYFYICNTEKLFERRDFGWHGVTWKTVKEEAILFARSDLLGHLSFANPAPA